VTAPTPEQMRALAARAVQSDDGHTYSVPARDLIEYNVALRAAADQLEAVHGALWGGRVTTSAVVRVANARQFLPRSTADTAPQEDRDE